MINMENFKIINGNNLDVLDTLEEKSIDAIITDPPYELGFMGKKWDASGIAYNVSLWEKALKVLKPGGHLLAFGGSRTFHRVACAIEDAGFEIRDTIMYLYGSGFPKSQNIGLAIDKKIGVESKVVGTGKSGSSSRAYQSEEMTTAGCYEIKEAQNEWRGWGTCLKPAFEPIIVARKPFKGTLVENVLKNRVGAINIDECRVPLEEGYKAPIRSEASQNYALERKGLTQCDMGKKTDYAGANVDGRFPANVIHDGSEEVIKDMPNSNGAGGSVPNVKVKGYGNGIGTGESVYTPNDRTGFNSGSGSVSRYFYCAKASSKDRNEGLEEFEDKTKVFNGQSGESSKEIKDVEKRFTTVCKNIHPTVKPTSLMQYLVRLVCPKGATILDIFNGSGSTGKAVAYENVERNANYKYIGIEPNKEYCDISEARIKYVLNKKQDDKDSYVQLNLLGEE